MATLAAHRSPAIALRRSSLAAGRSPVPQPPRSTARRGSVFGSGKSAADGYGGVSIITRDGWDKVTDPTVEAPYYYCHLTGETQWEPPPQFLDTPLEWFGMQINDPCGSATTWDDLAIAAARRTAIRSHGDWCVYWDETSGHEYFYNVITQDMQWEPPCPELELEPLGHEYIATLLCYNPFNPRVPHPLAVHGQWQLFIDPATENRYYYNPVTGASSWSAPDEWEDDQATVPPLTTVDDWAVYRDPATLLEYFVNSSTGATSWTVPAEIASRMPRRQEVHVVADNMPEARVGDWYVYVDPKSQHLYFYHGITGVTQWEAPPEVLNAAASEWQSMHIQDVGDEGVDADNDVVLLSTARRLAALASPAPLASSSRPFVDMSDVDKLRGASLRSVVSEVHYTPPSTSSPIGSERDIGNSMPRSVAGDGNEIEEDIEFAPPDTLVLQSDEPQTSRASARRRGKEPADGPISFSVAPRRTSVDLTSVPKPAGELPAVKVTKPPISKRASEESLVSVPESTTSGGQSRRPSLLLPAPIAEVKPVAAASKASVAATKPTVTVTKPVAESSKQPAAAAAAANTAASKPPLAAVTKVPGPASVSSTSTVTSTGAAANVISAPVGTGATSKLTSPTFNPGRAAFMFGEYQRKSDRALNSKGVLETPHEASPGAPAWMANQPKPPPPSPGKRPVVPESPLDSKYSMFLPRFAGVSFAPIAKPTSQAPVPTVAPTPIAAPQPPAPPAAPPAAELDETDSWIRARIRQVQDRQRKETLRAQGIEVSDDEVEPAEPDSPIEEVVQEDEEPDAELLQWLREKGMPDTEITAFMRFKSTFAGDSSSWVAVYQAYLDFHEAAANAGIQARLKSLGERAAQRERDALAADMIRRRRLISELKSWEQELAERRARIQSEREAEAARQAEHRAALAAARHEQWLREHDSKKNRRLQRMQQAEAAKRAQAEAVKAQLAAARDKAREEEARALQVAREKRNQDRARKQGAAPSGQPPAPAPAPAPAPTPAPATLVPSRSGDLDAADTAAGGAARRPKALQPPVASKATPKEFLGSPPPAGGRQAPKEFLGSPTPAMDRRKAAIHGSPTPSVLSASPDVRKEPETTNDRKPPKPKPGVDKTAAPKPTADIKADDPKAHRRKSVDRKKKGGRRKSQPSAGDGLPKLQGNGKQVESTPNLPRPKLSVVESGRVAADAAADLAAGSLSLPAL